MILHLAVRELRHSGRKLFLVLFILFIGFIGPFLSSSLRSSVSEYLATRSRQILSADLAVSSMKPFEDPVRDQIRDSAKPLRQIEETEFVTMAKGREVATLVEVKGVDPEFPIYGTFRFQTADGKVDHEKSGESLNAKPLSDSKIAWAFPEVLAQLGLKAGDEIGIGKTQFKIAAVLEDAPGMARAGGFAPRLYVGRKYLEETGLTQYGAQVFHRIYLQLAPGTDAENLHITYKDPDIFVKTPADSIQGIERFFKFFNLYLVTVTMIVFVLSWMSAFYILQIFLQERLKNAAIFMVNGGGRLVAGVLSALQVLIIMSGAFLVAGLLTELVAFITNHFFQDRLPPAFLMIVPLRDWLTLGGIALASAIAFNGPFFTRLWLLKLQTLLSENAMGNDRLPRVTSLITYAPLLILFLGLAAWLMESWSESLRLAGGMALAAGFGYVVGRALFRAFFAALKRTPGDLRLVATQLARSRFGVNLCFLALVLVSLSLNLVPHLLTSVVSEMQPLRVSELPSLFLFNIPESGLDKMKAFASDKKIELRYLSPMVLGRLLNVNGKEAESSQLQRFPVRLSYRETRIPSETLVAGTELPLKPVAQTLDGAAESVPDAVAETVAEISVEEKFAERNGFKLGDVIEFDVQSLPIKAKITSLRKVKWSTFNPNFFIMFQPGILDDAPKTWIANVNFSGTDEAANREKKIHLQYELTRDFPDVSVIDIGRTIERVLTIAQSIIGPVTAAAWSAVAMSFLILLGVISHNLRLREREIDVQKLLGADAPLIRRLLVGEYAITASFAWLVGASASLAIAWAVARQVLDIPLTISWGAIIGSGLATILVTSGITYISASRVLQLRGTSRRL